MPGGLLAASVLLAIVRVLLYGWAVAAGAHILATVLFLGVRLGRQGAGQVEMAKRL